MFLCLRLRCIVPQVCSWTRMVVGRERESVCVSVWDGWSNEMLKLKVICWWMDAADENMHVLLHMCWIWSGSQYFDSHAPHCPQQYLNGLSTCWIRILIIYIFFYSIFYLIKYFRTSKANLEQYVLVICIKIPMTDTVN